MKKAELKNSLQWIVGILNKHNIPFQITGGLAAKIYGSPRKLNDIDIDIYDEDFPKLLGDVKPYIKFGPAPYKDKKWDLMLAVLDYNGQLIDIAGIRNMKISSKNRTKWLTFNHNLSKPEKINYLGMILPVVKKEELIEYKNELDGEPQQIDIEAIRKHLNGKGC